MHSVGRLVLVRSAMYSSSSSRPGESIVDRQNLWEDGDENNYC